MANLARRTLLAARRSDADFLEAIKTSAGIKSIIAQRLCVSRETVDKRIMKSERLLKAYSDEVESTKDYAEGIIIENLKQKDLATAKWYLQLKARERGYGETKDITETIDSRLEIVFSGKDASDED